MPILETVRLCRGVGRPPSSDRVRSEALIGTNEAALAQGRLSASRLGTVTATEAVVRQDDRRPSK
jgi:hypothetical protein